VALGAVVVTPARHKSHPGHSIQPYQKPDVTPAPRPSHRPSESLFKS
jgi:hypothetical protein